MGFGRAEAAYTWNGDLQIAPNGDFVTLIDTPSDPAATRQRVIQLICTNAIDTVYDYFGAPVALRPDDLFNPKYGSSIRRLIGANATQDTLNKVKARLLATFDQEPGIAKTPAPVVNVAYVGGHVVVNFIKLYDLAGNAILIPSEALPVFGSQS